MSLIKIVGKAMPKLKELEAGFWSALARPDFQAVWNQHRRDFLAAAIASISPPVDAPIGTERTFRLLDRTYRTRFRIAVAEADGFAPLPVGLIEFSPDQVDEPPFFTTYHDDEGRFGVSPFELNQAVLTDADGLCELFDKMAEAAGSRYLRLRDGTANG